MLNNTSLKLIEKLCSTLEQEGVVYCHWKSTAALERSASGENDLDLLVSRTDARRFIEILSHLGFKETFAPGEQQLPGVLDFFGFDQETGKLVHVHLHFQLVMGHDLYKNYHLPLEKPFLESAVHSGLFKIPKPELEWIILVIRLMVKHFTWNAYFMRHTFLANAERQELEYLRSRIDPSLARQLLEKYLPCISPELFEACVQSLQPGQAFWFRIRTGNRLQHSLAVHTRRAPIAVLFLQVWRRYFIGIPRRITGYRPRLRLANGGLFMAVVGEDGSGNIPAVEGLCEWLAAIFEVQKIRAAGDRDLSYVKARRFATRGGLVICDHCPPSASRLLPDLVYVIDASQTQEQVLTELKKAVWSMI